jgi:trans-AT polyketide synthase, acyltransferase and oxidoreductase domains
MLAYVFPGQGSQEKGMGGDLFDEFDEFTEIADKILGYSIKQLCLEDPYRQLNQTQYTQPALYVVNALCYYEKLKERGKTIHFLAGHSLGEYNALLAADAIDFETGLKLVKKRGELMSNASGGAMAAVLNLNEQDIQSILDQNGLSSIDIANYNAPSQIVISGLKAHINRAAEIFEAMAIRCVVLNVSAAFHSRYMRPIQDEFERYLKTFTFSKLETPVISNVTGEPYQQNEIVANLSAQITHSVKWTESMRYLMTRRDRMFFEEVGPGDVLIKLIDKIQHESTTPLITPSQSFSNSNTAQRLIRPESLGDKAFKQTYGLKYAYLTGAMFKGIASPELVIRMGKAGMMGFLGTGGLKLHKIESSIQIIQQALKTGEAYGMNLLHNPIKPKMEEETVDLYLKYGIKNIEAAAFMQITPALVKYRLKGLRRDSNGRITTDHRIIAKLSRPEIAELFLSPPPAELVKELYSEREISREAAQFANHLPMADDICVEADSAGHTDMGILSVLLPTIMRQRDELMNKQMYAERIRVGAAGGIGTPEAAATAFILGADFILTGSINQCTVEANTSDTAKDLLQEVNIQDTDYAPAGDMFELGAKVQVVRKSVFFPGRGNRLYELYRHYNSLDELDEKTKTQIQDKYFKRSFEEVYAETKAYYSEYLPEVIDSAERNPKRKMALIFRWYFIHSIRLAQQGDPNHKIDYQIHCGPAMGAFNQWVKGTILENWRNRHVDEIAEKMMIETAALLNRRFQSLSV